MIISYKPSILKGNVIKTFTFSYLYHRLLQTIWRVLQMDHQPKSRPPKQEKAEQKEKHREPFNPEQHSSFTDKERKREEIKQSTIGGF